MFAASLCSPDKTFRNTDLHATAKRKCSRYAASDAPHYRIKALLFTFKRFVKHVMHAVRILAVAQ